MAKTLISQDCNAPSTTFIRSSSKCLLYARVVEAVESHGDFVTRQSLVTHVTGVLAVFWVRCVEQASGDHATHSVSLNGLQQTLGVIAAG